MHKTITKMVKEEILVKEGKKYLLNTGWVMSSKQFFSFVEKNYKEKKHKNIPYSKAHLQNYVKYTFESAEKLGIFLLDYYFMFPNPKKEPGIIRWFCMYSMIGLPKDNRRKIKKLIRENIYYAICETNTLYDKFIAKAFKFYGHNANIKLGIKCSDECDYIVVGNYVARIYLCPELKNRLYKLQGIIKTVPTFNLQELFALMNNEFNPPHYIIIEKDSAIAKQLRESTMKYFNKKV